LVHRDSEKVLGRSFKTSGDAIMLLGDRVTSSGGEYWVTRRMVAASLRTWTKAERALQQLLVAAIREGC
jgi:hypothetical protein